MMKKTRQTRFRPTAIVVFAATTLLLPGCLNQQVELGRSYILYTPRQDACPVLMWRFVVDAQRAITGTVVPYAGTHPAVLSGTLNPDDTYQMTATPEQSGPPTRVTGHFSQRLTDFTIDGDAVGPACDKRTLKLNFDPIYGPTAGGRSR